jgi:hypothetical protein
MTDAHRRLPNSSRLSIGVWVALGLLVLGLLFGLAAPQTYPAGSTYDSSLKGYAQWYALMQQQGHPIRRWQRSYDKLKELKETGQTLIQVADVEVNVAENLESSDIRDWVKQGNRLIILAWGGWVSSAAFRSNIPSPQGAVQVETTRRFLTSRDTTPVLQDAAGNVICSKTLGKGEIIEGSYPYLGANVYAQRQRNLQFLAALAAQQDGTLWVDEWLHGYRDRDPNGTSASAKAEDQSLWDYLARQPVALLLGQGVLLCLLVLWSVNQRFGRLLSLAPPSRNNSEQYIQALADTLNAHGHRAYVLSILGQSLRNRLQARLGLGWEVTTNRVPDTVIANAWATATGRPSRELLELLEQTHASDQISDQALLQWARTAETTLRELP